MGNADCTLIKLDNGKTIIVDCQILEDLTDGHGKQVMFDVKADLLQELHKDVAGRPYVDLFISTHPHDDHCKGFVENFYHGDVADYDKDKNKDEIIIEELWITPRGLNNNLSAPAEDIRKEAKRRRKLYDDDANFNGSKGNYLRIIGYDKDKEFDSRYTALSFKTTSIILVILRKTIIFAHSDAGSTASGVSFYRSYKIIFVGGNQMRQRSFFDFRLNFRYAKIRFILLICNILHV